MTLSQRTNVERTTTMIGGENLADLIAAGKVLTTKQICERYGFSRQNVNSYSGTLLREIRDAGGRNVYYRLEDVEAWRAALKFQRKGQQN